MSWADAILGDVLQQVPGGRLVGRDSELGRLLGLLDEAAAGRPVVALVSGDAGVGKTRLVDEVSAAAGELGFTVLSGHCAELGDSVPYLPVGDALRGAAQLPGLGERVRDAVAARPVLGQMLPDAGTLAPSDGEGTGLARQQMFGAVLGLLAELATASPVLLVLEDLHWADASTRDLLTFLSRVLHRERIAILGTYRTDDLHRRHPLRPLVAELLRLPNVTSVELGPLATSAMAEHLAESGGAGLDAAALNRIIERAEGNTYYAEELLAATDSGGSRGGVVLPAVLPAELAGLLLGRVERLSPTAQQVVRVAAVAGRRADDEIVRAVSGLPEAEYEHAVREAVAHQVLVPAGTDGYTFRHALLREAVYADLLPGERTRLHATIATLLASGNAAPGIAAPGTPGAAALEMVPPGTAAELAYHYLASHDIPGAFAASLRAAKEAVMLAAPAEAHRHYDQALALWDRVSDPEKVAGQSRAELALRSANNAAFSGDVAGAIHQLRRLRGFLLAAEPGRHSPELVSRAGERLAYLLLQSDRPDVLAEAAEAARAAVEVAPENPPTRERARAMATLAIVLLGTDEDAASRDWAARARVAAQEAGAPSTEADALVTLGLLSAREGDNTEAIEKFTAAYRQVRGSSMIGVELRVAYHLARAHLERGELAEAAAVAHEGVRRAEETGLGLAPFGLDVQHLHFQAHFADGSWDHAQQIADGFTVRATTVGEALLSAMALFIDVARGNQVAAERRTWLEPFWPADFFSEYIGRGNLAERALWQGDTQLALDDAAAAIRTDVDTPRGAGPSVIRVAAVALSARADRARQARDAGNADAEKAEMAAARELIELARVGAVYPYRPKFELGREGKGWLARAEAEWRRAQGDNAPEAWEAVLEEFGPAYPYETARTRWRLAEALAEAGQRDEATEQWRQAVQLADQLRAAPLRAALNDLARRARLGRGGQGSSGQADGALAALTERELEVLLLIAQGRSNREIGAALFIAPKTASVHVSNILAKLGAASRTEAAAIAHREGRGA
jgi:DNA-binding CsgD family transcriptional regulator